MQRHPRESQFVRLVERVGVQRLVGNNMVLQQCPEVGLAVRAEEEGKDLRPKKLEAMVIWREEGGADSVGLSDIRCEPSFGESELEGGELAGEVR